VQSGLDVEKQKVQHRERDTFNAQYQLAAVQEELDKLRAHLKIVEEEKDALKTSLKEEEVARMAAEGMIALPVSHEDDDMDLLSSPTKRSSPKKKLLPSPLLLENKENSTPRKVIENKRRQEELQHEQMRREHAEEMVEFLTMECKFRCCSCQSAAGRGEDHSVAVSEELAATLESIMEGMRAVLAPPGDLDQPEQMQMDVETLKEEKVAVVDAPVEPAADDGREAVQVQEEQVAEDDDRSMTMAAEDVQEHLEQQFQSEPEAEPQQTVEDETPVAPRPTPAVHQNEQAALATEPEHTAPPTAADYLPQTPPHHHHDHHHHHAHAHSIRTITTTTRVPMHFTPLSKPHLLPFSNPIEDAENIPPVLDSTTASATITSFSSHSHAHPQDQLLSTSAPAGKSFEIPFDRAAALAAIEYRRGRAKSFAAGHMTPRKQVLEGLEGGGGSGWAGGIHLGKDRRDISAPALGQQARQKGLKTPPPPSARSFEGVSGARSVGRGVQGRRMG
jgi:hypothetical protein